MRTSGPERTVRSSGRTEPELRAAAAAPPPVRRPTKPSRGARERRIAAKKRRGITKRNRRAFPDD
ncbi:hypothetical protein ACSVDM_10700 [Nocardia sp. JW2]|uniref:hypothetical protein n=1 Tax=Nocardia sp. JW2 TaxID=3450738 RepID=UPI003F43F81D